MKKYLFFLICLPLLAVENRETIDIAKANYGAKSVSKNIIDNDKSTAEDISGFTVKFPSRAKLDEIELKFVPANGKIIFKAIKGDKEVVLCQVNITEKDTAIKFSTDKDEEYLEIQIEWIPKISDQKLTVIEFSAITSDKDTIYLYKEISNSIQKNYFDNKMSEAAGFEVEKSLPVTKTVDVNLPTQFTISRSSF